MRLSACHRASACTASGSSTLASHRMRTATEPGAICGMGLATTTAQSMASMAHSSTIWPAGRCSACSRSPSQGSQAMAASHSRAEAQASEGCQAASSKAIVACIQPWPRSVRVSGRPAAWQRQTQAMPARADSAA